MVYPRSIAHHGAPPGYAPRLAWCTVQACRWRMRWPGYRDAPGLAPYRHAPGTMPNNRQTPNHRSALPTHAPCMHAPCLRAAPLPSWQVSPLRDQIRSRPRDHVASHITPCVHHARLAPRPCRPGETLARITSRPSPLASPVLVTPRQDRRSTRPRPPAAAPPARLADPHWHPRVKEPRRRRGTDRWRFL